jgi:4-hydroxy-tetrahydrodipicolinate synthase
MTLVDGLSAALPTPLRRDGRVDLRTLDRIVDLVVEAGVDGICIGGATSEYPHFDVAERVAVIERVADRLTGDTSLLVGVGAPSTSRVVELAHVAAASGARALLLPMPMFFNYEQDDLTAYCAELARRLPAPCLLYDLPEFTNPLSIDTTLALLHHEPSIVGIKDSSGLADNLTTLALAPGRNAWTLLVGDDRLLHQALDAGWNGGVSGVAACCPELVVALVRAIREREGDEAIRLQELVVEVIAHLSVLPTPWGIRVALAARGIDTGPLPLPLTSARQQQVKALQEWIAEFVAGWRRDG